MGSKVRLHLRKTGGEGVGVRAGVRSWVGEDVGTRQQCQCETKARNRVGSGDKGLVLGRVRTLKQDSLQANRGLGSRRRLLAHRPFASRPRLPSSPPTTNSPRGGGAGSRYSLPGQHQIGNRGLCLLTPSRRLSFRPRPRPAQPIAEPTGAVGGASAPGCPRLPSARTGAWSWEARDTVRVSVTSVTAVPGEAWPLASEGMRPHCSLPLGSTRCRSRGASGVATELAGEQASSWKLH